MALTRAQKKWCYTILMVAVAVALLSVYRYRNREDFTSTAPSQCTRLQFGRHDPLYQMFPSEVGLFLNEYVHDVQTSICEIENEGNKRRYHIVPQLHTNTNRQITPNIVVEANLQDGTDTVYINGRYVGSFKE